MTAVLHIGNRNYSSWSLRAALMLDQSGLACRERVIPLDRADSAAALAEVGPSGLVPVLHHADLVIWDSLAIGEYLAEQAPRAGLWPAEAGARALARCVSAEMHSGFGELRARMPMDLRGRHPQPASTPGLRADIERILAIWQQCRARHAGAGDFLFGAWCIADAMFAPVVSRFRSYGVALSGAPGAYAEAVWRWPAMARWAQAAAAEPWVIDLGL